MSSSKIVLIVDVSSQQLKQLLDIAIKFVTERMYNTPNNCIAVILTGTGETDVSLIKGNVDHFTNIKILHPLQQYDTTKIRELRDVINEHYKSTESDVAGGLEAALRLYHQEPTKTHWMSENRILLFTDERCQYNGDSDSIAAEMNSLKPAINLTMVGLDMENSNKNDHCKRLEELKDKVNSCHSLNIEDAADITQVYKTKKVKQSTVFKGCLEIGSVLNLPVYGFTKIMSASGVSLKKCDRDGKNLVRDRVYHLEDENLTEVDPNTIIKGYRYGKQFVPISKVDESLIKKEQDKELSLICTTPRINIRKEELGGKSSWVLCARTEDEGANKGLAAFIQALHEEQLVAICRYIKKDDASPKICALIPSVGDWSYKLYMVELPYAEDIRHAEFPRLKSKVSSDQLEAVNGLIDKLDLSKKNFKPTGLPNPQIQRRFDCVQHRALHPEDAMPNGDISQYLNIPLIDCDSEVEALQRGFEVRKVEVKNMKRTADEMFKEELLEDEAGELKRVKKEDISIDSHLGVEVSVGTADPITDFEVVTKKMGVEHACASLTEVIKMLLQYKADTTKIVSCLSLLRDRSTQLQILISKFNEFLRETVTTLTDLKNICVQNSISLIHRGENTNSDVTKEESDSFLYDDLIVAASVDDAIDDEDDLLDDL